MTEEKLPQLLCKSKLISGEYDDLIKDHIKKMISAIMTESHGRENPKMVVNRIKKIVGEYMTSNRVAIKEEKPFEFQGVVKEFHEFIDDEPIIFETHELYDADPNCEHETYSAPGGGVKCKHCLGWFCF